MKKLFIALVLLIPNFAFAQNVGKCGFGSKLFEGQRGIAPQVLAVTTNGTFFNTVGITSGTSGCTQDGVVRSNWKTVAYIDSNMTKIAKDMSRGEGESLDSLASVIGVKKSDNFTFKVAMKENFNSIFSSSNVDSQAVYLSIKNILAKNSVLKTYAVNM